MDFALAGIYDQLKKPKEAAAAYQAAARAGARQRRRQARSGARADRFGQIGRSREGLCADPRQTDPQDAQVADPCSRIERAEGPLRGGARHAEEGRGHGLRRQDAELSYNEALIYDALGRYDEAIKTLKHCSLRTAAPDGKYTDGETEQPRPLPRSPGIVYREQGKTAEAVAAYKQMAAAGRRLSRRVDRREVDTYRDAHQWAKELQVLQRLRPRPCPTNHDVQLMYARQLADTGKVDEAIKLAEAQLDRHAGRPRRVLHLADMDARAQALERSLPQLWTRPRRSPPSRRTRSSLVFSRGSVAERQKLYDQAETEFRKALAIDPQNAAIENYLGYMLAERGVKLR